MQKQQQPAGERRVSFSWGWKATVRGREPERLREALQQRGPRRTAFWEWRGRQQVRQRGSRKRLRTLMWRIRGVRCGV